MIKKESKRLLPERLKSERGISLINSGQSIEEIALRESINLIIFKNIAFM